MKRPLGFIASAYACGLLCAESFQLPLLLLFAISAALALTAIAASRARARLIWPLVFVVAWTNFTRHTAVISPHDLRRIIGDAPEDVRITGVLSETPVEYIYITDGRESSRSRAQIRVSHLHRRNGTLAAFGTIIVSIPEPLGPRFFSGQTVDVSGIVSRPAPPVAPGLFDYRAYLKRQGIHFEMRTTGAQDWMLLSTNNLTPPVSDRFLGWAKAALGRDLPEQDEPLRLLWAMTLGLKTSLPRDAYAPFIQSGTMHIFAISGLHIALVAGILVSVLRVLQVSRLWCGLLVIPTIWFYTAATGWQSSAVRSTIMMTIVICGWSLKRPGDLLNSLMAAALVILVWDPQQIFQAGFQLSFLVVASIALMVPPIENLCNKLTRHDPLLPSELVPRWRRMLNTPLRVFTRSFTTSLAAWLGSWPLTACYFHLFSPVTLLSNLLVVPLGSAALAANIGSLFCAPWFPWASQCFNHCGWLTMKIMVALCQWTITIPGSYFHVSAPRVSDFIIYYTSLFAVLSGAAFVRRWRTAVLVWIVCVAAFYGWHWKALLQTTRITVLPLNGGSAVFSDMPRRENDLIIDCGNTNSVVFTVEPFLRTQGIDEIASMILTHGDLRNVGGTERLRALIPISRIATSPIRHRSSAYRRIVDSLASTPAHRVIQRGDTISGWTVLHPDRTDRFPSADDNTVVLIGTFCQTRILLLSDLGRSGQETLLARTRELRADIVVAGLPDKGEPLSEALLDAIEPRMIVIVDSEFPATRRAGTQLRERLARRGVPVVCTRESGAVGIDVNPRGWMIRSPGGFRSEGTPGPGFSRAKKDDVNSPGT